MQFMTEGSTTSTIPTTDFCVKEIEFEDLKFGIWVWFSSFFHVLYCQSYIKKNKKDLVKRPKILYK